MLYMATLTARTYNPLIRAMAQRLTAAGKTVQGDDYRVPAEAADPAEHDGAD